MAPGLIRIGKNGLIVPCDYDFESKRLGPLYAEVPLAYMQDYSATKCLWREWDLWHAIARDPHAIGAAIFNNTYLVTIHPGWGVFLEKGSEDSPWTPPFNCKLTFVPATSVGFARTVPKYKDLNLPPQLLYVDVCGNAYTPSGKLMPLKDAVPCKDTALYKHFFDSDCDAVYMSDTGVKEVYWNG